MSAGGDVPQEIDSREANLQRWKKLKHALKDLRISKEPTDPEKSGESGSHETELGSAAAMTPRSSEEAAATELSEPTSTS